MADLAQQMNAAAGIILAQDVDVARSARVLNIARSAQVLRDFAVKVKALETQNTELRIALQDLLNVIEADDLIPESLSYMKQARGALARARGEQP